MSIQPWWAGSRGAHTISQSRITTLTPPFHDQFQKHHTYLFKAYTEPHRYNMPLPIHTHHHHHLHFTITHNYIHPLTPHLHTGSHTIITTYTTQLPTAQTHTQLASHTNTNTAKRVHTKPTTHTQIHKPKTPLVFDFSQNTNPTYRFTQTNQPHTHHPWPKITAHHQPPICDPYMGSPKSRVRVRVSREFEREGEAIDAVREKCRERERGKARPCRAKILHHWWQWRAAVVSGKRSSSVSSCSWPWSRW